MAYVKFDTDSTSPQVVNFKEIEQSSLPYIKSPIPFANFRSFKQISPEDVVGFPGIPVSNRTHEPPDSFIAVAEAIIDSGTGAVSWRGRSIPHSIILLPAEDTENGGRGSLEVLLAYLRGIGETIPVLPPIPQSQDIRIENLPPANGQQSSTVFKLTATGAERVGNIQAQTEPQTEMQMEEENDGGGTGEAEIPIQVQPQDQPQIQPQPEASGGSIGTSRSSRVPSSNYLSPEIQRQPLGQLDEEEEFPMEGDNEYMTADFVAMVDADFDPSAIVQNIAERYTKVLNRNVGIRDMSEWPQIKELLDGTSTKSPEELEKAKMAWGGTSKKVQGGVKLMSSGLHWIKGLKNEIPKFYTAQAQILPQMKAQEAAWDRLLGKYEAFEEKMNKIIDEYRDLGFPTEENTDVYNEAIENLFKARDAFEMHEAPIKKRIEALNERYLEKEREFWNFTLNTYRYLRNIELSLQSIRVQLGVDSPVHIHGIDDKPVVTADDYDDLVILHDQILDEVNQIDTSELDELFVKENYARNQMAQEEEDGGS
ncbi:hypothetical protein TWF694_008109 [Orbilia ellipsospora]|uniref:Uncharacterized protein n=1 Tax=Orbilia ellipsospora TaxID=2528407 RepID=A0AAV9XFN2_9PEZI